MMFGCPVTVEHNRDSYPSWPDMKYPSKKVERARPVDDSPEIFSSLPSRLSGSSHPSGLTSVFLGHPTGTGVLPSTLNLNAPKSSMTRNNVDDTLTSRYLSASGYGDDASTDLPCPPMATSPLSQHDDDEASPLQQCIDEFARQDREYNPPFKIPRSVSLDLEPEHYVSNRNQRPPRNRSSLKAYSPLVSSRLTSGSFSDDYMSTPPASNPSSYSSAVSTISSVSTGIDFHPLSASGRAFDLTAGEFDDVLELSAQQDHLDLEEEDDILTPICVSKSGSTAASGTPKARSVKFSSSSTRHIDYRSFDGTIPTNEVDVDDLIDSVYSAKSNRTYDFLSSSNTIDTIVSSRMLMGRGRSSTSASAPPSLPTVFEASERTSEHSCDDFAVSVTSLENNASTCSSRCSTNSRHGVSANIDIIPSPSHDVYRALHLPPNVRSGRGRSMSDSLAERLKKRGEDVAKTARFQWFNVTLHMRLRAFQAKELMKKTSLKQLLRRSSSKADLDLE